MALETNESTEHNDGGQAKKERRKRRWGNAAPDASASVSGAPAAGAVPAAAAAAPLDPKAKVLAMQESIRARLAAAKAKQAGGAAPPLASVAASASVPATVSSTPATGGTSLKRPAETSTATESSSTQTSSKRAKVYELDMSVTGPAVPSSNKPVRKINPYLAHLEVAVPPKKKDKDAESVAASADAIEDENVDERLVRASKPRPRHKTMSFVEPGTYQELAEKKRDMAKAAAASGFVSGRKTGHTIHSNTMAAVVYGPGQGSTDANADVDDGTLAPRADAHPDTTMPLALEWWDAELLPIKLKKQVAAAESQKLSKQTKAALQNLGGTAVASTTIDNDDDNTNTDGNGDENDKKETTALEQQQQQKSVLSSLQAKCLEQASLSYSKTAALVQHIVPVKPPNANSAPAKQAVLHLTKKELKRQRKLRRGEKQRELQDLQAAGLIPAPEPRLTLSNFIRVLGDQAFLDPSQMEHKVAEQMQARQRAHLEKNQANKLTKEQRAAKRVKKLTEDTSQGVTVAIFFVRDMSHPYHRTKVDLNAQQNFLTGGVLECQDPALSCVIIEGGPKAIKRYTRLMTVRMKWKGPDDANDSYEEEQVEEEGDLDDDDTKEAPPKFNPDNKCELVWQGMGVKRLFKGFVFQSCESSDQARKVLKQKGVGHYWDQVLQHASGRGDSLQLKLTSTDNQDDDGNAFAQDDDEDEDIVMQDS
jgi:U4/U6 small nuclear ribonucleoprotein PRP3